MNHLHAEVAALGVTKETIDAFEALKNVLGVDAIKGLLAELGVSRLRELSDEQTKAFTAECRKRIRATGIPNPNLYMLARPLTAPSWFVNPGQVAVHPMYGTDTTSKTYGPLLFPTHGLALLVGDPKAGKTTWLIDRLSKWKSPYGGKLRSVFISLESQATAMQGAASFELEYPDRNTVQVIPASPASFNLLDTESIDRLAAEIYPDAGDNIILSDKYNDMCKRTQHPDVLVLDSLSRAIGGLDENASSTMSAVISGLEYMREAFGADLLIVLHHTAKGKTDPRGHGSLLGGIDSSVHLSRKGHGEKAVVTVRCTDARSFEDGHSRKYTRRVATHVDLMWARRDLTRLEFDEVTDTAPAKATDAPPASQASPAPATAPTTQPDAPQAAPVPQAPPPHPADSLKGRAATVWVLLALGSGESIGLEDAKSMCIGHPCFADVPKDRRGDRWKEVVAAFTKRGLVDTAHGLVVNPK